MKPEYEKLLKRAFVAEKYADAEAIKRAIGALEIGGGDARRFVGTWRSDNNREDTFTLREDGKVDVSRNWNRRPKGWRYSEEENKLFFVGANWYLVEKDENTLVEVNLNPGKNGEGSGSFLDRAVNGGGSTCSALTPLLALKGAEAVIPSTCTLKGRDF
ncbi:MAG: hypothetical protein LBS59_06815 [Puniceicoccales bacterium]|nr:hypothetical protein [Puniceicoccales bacterium]